MNKGITTIILALLMVGGAAAISVDVSPQTYDFDIISGQNHTQNLTISYTGNRISEISIESNITAEDTNSNGLQVKYSHNNFYLGDEDKKEIRAVIQSSEALKPDNFTITHTVSAEAYRDDDDGGGSDDYYIDVEQNISEESTTDSGKDSEKGEIDGGEQGGDEISSGEDNQTDNNETGQVNPDPEVPTKDGDNLDVVIGVILFIIFAIIGGEIYLKRNEFKEWWDNRPHNEESED